MIAPKRLNDHALGLVVVLGLAAMAACGSDDGEEPVAATPASESADATEDDTASVDTEDGEGAAASSVAVPFTDVELVAACIEEPASGTPAATEPGILVDAEGLRYCVGPAIQVGIESAAAVDAPFGPSVEPILTESGIEAFNHLAGECFDPKVGNSSCPSGQIAIVIDGRVLSAPTINAAEFTRDQLVITGTFTIEEAGAIADAMAAEELLTIRPVLLVLGPDGP